MLRPSPIVPIGVRQKNTVQFIQQKMCDDSKTWQYKDSLLNMDYFPIIEKWTFVVLALLLKCFKRSAKIALLLKHFKRSREVLQHFSASRSSKKLALPLPSPEDEGQIEDRMTRFNEDCKQIEVEGGPIVPQICYFFENWLLRPLFSWARNVWA